MLHYLHERWDSLGAVATLWVYGAILIALFGDRIQRLEAEVVERPMRSFALGVVGLSAAILSVIVLCVTLIGIPIAVIGVIAALLLGYAGAVAVLAALGHVLLNHRSTNRYVHLAVGCAIYFVASSVPWVGQWVTVTLALAGIGVVIATRAAGLIKERAVSADPYPSPVL